VTSPQCYRVLYFFLSPVCAWRQPTFSYFSVVALSLRGNMTRPSSLTSAMWTPYAKGKRDRPTHVLASFYLPVLSRPCARCHCPKTLPPLPVRQPVVHFQDHCSISVCHDVLFLSERLHHSRHSHATTISTYTRLAAIPFFFWVSCLLVLLQCPVCICWCVVGSTCSAPIVLLLVVKLLLSLSV
jgi:hypothetical protein